MPVRGDTSLQAGGSFHCCYYSTHSELESFRRRHDLSIYPRKRVSRVCLNCSVSFLDLSPFIRLCPACRRFCQTGFKTRGLGYMVSRGMKFRDSWYIQRKRFISALRKSIALVGLPEGFKHASFR